MLDQTGAVVCFGTVGVPEPLPATSRLLFQQRADLVDLCALVAHGRDAMAEADVELVEALLTELEARIHVLLDVLQP